MRGHVAFVMLLALARVTVSEEGEDGGNKEDCHDEYGGTECNEGEETTPEGEKYTNETIGCEVSCKVGLNYGSLFQTCSIGRIQSRRDRSLIRSTTGWTGASAQATMIAAHWSAAAWEKMNKLFWKIETFQLQMR